MDFMMVDFGYVINTGWSSTQNYYVPADDEFVVEVQVQMSDHFLTEDGQDFPVQMTVTYGDDLAVGEKVTAGHDIRYHVIL